MRKNPGSSCSEADWANQGLAEFLISIFEPANLVNLKEKIKDLSSSSKHRSANLGLVEFFISVFEPADYKSLKENHQITFVQL